MRVNPLKIKMRWPLGMRSARSLSRRMSLDEAATMWSSTSNGSFSESGSISLFRW